MCKQQPQGGDDDVSCTMLDEPGFGDEPGFADHDSCWICKIRQPGAEGWGPFEEVDPNFALRSQHGQTAPLAARARLLRLLEGAPRISRW